MSFNAEKRISFSGPAAPDLRIASSLEELLDALRAHDPYTEGHSRRVEKYAAVIAELMGHSPRQVGIVRRAALAHDVGKLAVPERLLTKNTNLSIFEAERIRTHPVEGARLLSRTPSTRDLAEIVLHHHEHWDGMGYPSGLTGREIPAESRIILAVDAFDAMTTARPYDPRISARAALAEIAHCGGQQFDPGVVEAVTFALAEGLIPSDEVPALLT
jgi:polar amino acid transport system substrate-binding protein